MKITFIDHSGFLVELETCVLLFDYYKGEIPKVPGKKWYVFSSHFHEDHFNDEIFRLREEYDVTYILSKDIKKYRKKQLHAPYELVSWNEKYKIGDIEVETFHSTDEGCAFLVHVEGKDIYHAGDLHWWHWIGEQEEENQKMKQAFCDEMKLLEEKHIDLAFMLLDPRQEAAYDWGMNYFMEHTESKKVIPMHMWGKYELCNTYLQTEQGQMHKDRFLPIEREGQEIVLNL